MKSRFRLAAFAVALAGLVWTAGLAAARRWEWRLDRAARALEAGRPAQALRLGTLPSEHTTPESLFLRGTALLALGRDAEAAADLAEAAIRPLEVELRRRALHNLALAHLRLAAASARPGRDVHARASALAGREALRMSPSDLGPHGQATRWNLALAQRLVGGRGPDTTRVDKGAVEFSMGGTAAVESGVSRPLGRAEAQAILDALRSDEAASLERVLGRLFERGGLRAREGGPRW